MDRVRIGFIGCGNISTNYLTNAKNFPILEVAALADLDVSRAVAQAEKFEIPRACSVKEILRDKSIQIIVNLTVPAAHCEVALQAIRAGKHVVNEKPLGINRKEGRKILAAAEKKGVRVGCAPDTFLGAGHQTARKLIDDGAIGRPVAATAFMLSVGPEPWHPNPEFFYKPGGGPMLDMGPYYLTDLMQLLGRAKRVNGSATITIPERVVGKGPLAGQKITVETPDHITGTVEFESGCVATIITSFATFAKNHNSSPITIFGTEGTIQVPDPNRFDGPVNLIRRGETEYTTMPTTHCEGYGRSVGVADLAHAILTDRPHRVNGQQAMAVLDVMEGFFDSARTGRVYETKTDYERPAAMPVGLTLGQMG